MWNILVWKFFSKSNPHKKKKRKKSWCFLEMIINTNSSRMIGCGLRVVENLTSSLHMYWLLANVSVSVNDLPVCLMTLSTHFFLLLLPKGCGTFIGWQWKDCWLFLWHVHAIATSLSKWWLSGLPARPLSCLMLHHF